MMDGRRMGTVLDWLWSHGAMLAAGAGMWGWLWAVRGGPEAGVLAGLCAAAATGVAVHGGGRFASAAVRGALRGAIVGGVVLFAGGATAAPEGWSAIVALAAFWIVVCLDAMAGDLDD